MSSIKITPSLRTYCFAILAAFLAITSLDSANGAPPPTNLYWLGSNGTAWTAGNNWSTDASGSPTADFDSGPNIIFSANTSSNSSDTIIGGNLTTGQLDIISTAPVGISGGNLSVIGGLYVGGSSLSNTLLTINATMNIDPALYVGYAGSSNNLTITNGGDVTSDYGSIGYTGTASNNTLTITGTNSALTINGDLQLGFGANNNNNQVTVGANATLNVSGLFDVGHNGSSNNLTITSGGQVNIGAGGSSIGSFAARNNSVLIDGPGSQLTNTGVYYVGFQGEGNLLTISNQGAMDSGDLSVGGATGMDGNGSNNALLVTSNASMTISGTLNVGREGSSNSMTISGGGNVTSSEGNIGLGGFFGPSSNNTVTVNGANSSWTNSGLLTVGYDGSNNTLTVANNGTVSSVGGISIASQAGSGGTLNIGTFGDNGTGGTINAPSITFGDGTGTINFNQSNAVTLSANITGGGSVNILGTGNTTLNGTNTFTGNTTLSAGTLALGNANALSGSTLVHSNGATLRLALPGAATYNLGGLAGTGALAIGNNTLSIGGNNQTTTFAGAVSGNGSITKVGTGTLALSGTNTFTGNTTINTGTLVIANTGQISHSASYFAVGGDNSTATVTLDGGTISNAGGYIGFGNGSTGTVNINSGNWTNADNLRVGFYGNGTLNLTGGSISNVSGIIGRYFGGNGVANVSGGTWSSSGNMTIGNVATGTLNLTGGNVVVGSGSGNITIAQETISTGTLNLGTGSTVGTLQAARVTGGNGTAMVNFNHTGDYSFAPILAGSISVNILGNGTLNLTGNNSHTGGTTIQSGTLTGSSLGLKGNITNNATLLLGNSGTFVLNAAGSGNLLVSNNANAILLGNATMSGGTNIQSGSLTIGGRESVSSPVILGSISGNISNSGTLRFDMTSGNRTYADVISGNGSLGTTNSGSTSNGTLYLTGNNTYTGGTNVSVGSVDISVGSLSSTGNVSITTGGTFAIGASNQTIGGFLINGFQTAAATGTGSLTASSYDLRQGIVTLGLAGTAGLTKNSTGSGINSYENGVVYLAGNNTSTGDVTINSGILSFNTVQSLYSGNNASWTPSKISVSANSTLALGTGNGTASSGFNNDQIAEIFENLTANRTGGEPSTTGLTAGSSIGFNVASGNFTLNSTISNRPDGGSIGLDKIGGGVLILGVSSNFTGELNIFEGIVRAGTNNALSTNSSLVVTTKDPNKTSGYDLGDWNQEFVNVTLVSGTLAGGTGAITATGNYTMVSGTATANLGGAAPLTKNGTGIVILSGSNTYTGTTTVNGATWYPVPSLQWVAPSLSSDRLQFQTPGSLYTGNNATWNSGNITVNQYGIFSVLAGNGTAGFTDGQIGTLIANLITANRSSGGLLGGSAFGIDTTGTNMTLTTQLTDSGVVGGGRIGLVKYGTGTLTLTGNNTHSLLTSITGGTLALAPGATLSSSSANVAISQGAALDIGSTNQTITSLSSSGGNILGNGTITALATGNAFSFVGGNVSANLVGVGGAIIESPGNTLFSGSNTYSGITDVRSGATLRLANLNAVSGSTLNLVATSTVNFTVAGTYNLGGLAGSGNLSIGSNNLSIGANSENTTYSAILSDTGSITKVGNGTLTLSGNNTNTGGTTITGGTLALGAGGASGSVTGNITNNANLVFNRSGNVTFADIISGTGNVTKQGSGNLTISGNNTYTGSTTVSAGKLDLNGSLASTSVGINSGATLQNLNGGLVASATVANSGTFTVNATETLGSLAGNGSTVLNAALTTGGLNTNDEISGTISGNGSLAKAGTGALTLSGSNSYTGGTSISGGTLQVGNGSTTGSVTGNITNNAALVFNRSNTYTYNGVVSGSGSLQQIGNGTTILAGNNTYSGGTIITAGTLQGSTQSLQGTITNNATLVFNQTTNGTYSGVLSGSGEFAKTGTGTLTVSGNSSSFNGTAAINSGTVSLTGSIANAATTINSGGTLTGNGSLGALTINSGGAINPGNSPGILTVGNSVWNGGGIYNWELATANGTAGTGWDLINSTGNLTISANSSNKFIINASTTNASGFDPSVRSASWKIADFAAGITGFTADAFTINTIGFESLPAIYAFGVSSNGTALSFNYLTLATWTGGTGNWTDTSNWLNGAPPLNGVAVDYAGTNGTSSNDSSVSNIGGLTFTNSSTGSFTLAGAALTIGTGGITNDSAFTNTLSLNLTTTGNTVVNAGTLAIAQGASLTGSPNILIGNGTSGNAMNILGTVSAGNLTLSELGSSNNNTLTIGGGSSPASLTVSNLINVGFGGTGNTLDILGNGTVTAASTWIGGYGANNTLNLTGGVLNSTSDIIVGYFSDDNDLNTTAGGNAIVGSVTLGLDAGSSNNTIQVSGSNSALHASDLVYLGQSGTANSLLLENGGKVISQNANTVIGLNAGSNGNTLSINGTGSQFTQLTNNTTLYVGQGGSNNALSIANGGNLTTINSRIGGNASSANNTATVAGAGSVWSNSGKLRVGSFGSNNTLAITGGGSVVSSNDTFLGAEIGSSNNLLTVNGTGSTFSGATDLVIGYNGTSNALSVVNGGNVSLTGSLAIGYNAASANNTASVSGAGSILTAQNIQIGNGSNNKLIVADSALVSSGNIFLAGTNATVQIGNGASAGNLSLTGSITTGGTGGSVVFNHTDSSYQFSSMMSGDLAVNQIANGTTALTANNTYTGGTTISAGTLAIGNGGTTGSVAGDISNNATLAFNRSDAVEYAGVVSGSGALVKNGNNTLTLSGNNTYSGGTTVNSGTLAGTTSSLQGAIANAATVAFDQSTDGTFAGVMSGNGVLVKNGIGTVTLSGANSYSGGTTVNSGTLAGTTTSLQGAIANAATVAFDQSTNGIYAGTMSGNGVLVKNGSGTLTIGGANTHTGGTTINTGTLSLTGVLGGVTNNASFVVQQVGTVGAVTNNVGASATNNGTVASLLNAGTLINSGNITGNTTSTGTLTSTGVLAGNLQVNGGSTTIGNGGQVLGTSAISAGTMFVSGSVSDVTNGATFIVQQSGSATGVYNLATATNNGTVTTLINEANFTNSGNITGDVFSTSGSIAVTQSGRIFGNSTIGGGELTVSGTVANVTNNAELFVAQNGIAGDVTNLGGGLGTNSGTIASLLNSGTFSNAGNITNAATNLGSLENTGTISGALIIGNGTVTNSGVVGGLTTISGGVLQGNGTLGAVTLNSGGTIAPGTGNGTTTITVGNSTWNGGGIYKWQTSSLNGSAGTNWDLITSGGLLTLNATTGNRFTFNLSTLGNASLVDVKKASWEVGSFEGGISGFEKKAFAFDPAGMAGNDGRYFMSLGANNTALILNYKSAATWNTGSGNWTTPSQWEDNFSPTNGDEVEFIGVGGVSTNDFLSATLSTISGFNFLEGAGAYTVNGNTLLIGEDGIINASSNLQTIGMNLTAGEVLVVDTASAGIEISGVVSGNSAISKIGFDTLTLSGNNTYTGGTTISAGTLDLGGTAGAVVGNITVGSGATFSVNRTNDFTLGNIISGAGFFAHIGSNKTSITAANTYTGGTTISSGTLWVNNTQALGNGSVTLNGGKLLVTSSQEISMGNQSVSTFRTGSIDWNSGVVAFYDRDSSPEENSLTINVGGNFTVSTTGNATFDFSEVAALNSGNYTLVNATLVNADNNKFTAVHGPNTTLFGNFTTTANTVIYRVTGAVSGGSDIQNFGGPNTPVVANYNVTGPTVTIGANNRVNALTFSSSAPLTIQSGGELIVTSGTMAVQTGSSVVSGGTLNTPGNLDKTGTGELDLQNITNVNGIANVVDGLLSVNGQLNANEVVVDPNATLGGAGLIVAPGGMTIAGVLAPGNSPGVISIVSNPVWTSTSTTLIEIASPTNFDRIVVAGTATLDGTLRAVAYEGGTITPGMRYDFLEAASIVGEFDSIVVPDGLRGRFLNSGTVGSLLFGPASFVPYAINQNQINVAKALDIFVLATEGDAIVVGTALDSLTTEQFPAAFDQIMPGFYESLGDILIEQTYNQAQLLTQRLGTVRLGAVGFQAIGLSQPIKYDKDGKSAADAKTASPIVESAIATNWNSWVIANGEFSISRGLSGVPNYNNNAGGFLVGADYRLSENFAAGLFAGYEYSYAKYDGGSSTRGNSALFGLYGSYTHEDGYYADAIVSGGYTGFQTRRSIQFGTIDRTASADPNSGQFSAALNLGKDFEIGKFTLGPIIGAQYTYAGIGGFTESGADSLDLALGQQNANSLRTNLGARLAYNWEVATNITLIPEVRGFWMHEFLNGPRNISSALEGGSGPSFDYETSAPYRNSVFGGAGISAKIGDRWSGSVFYNVNFGAEGYTNNIISTSLGFSF